MSDTSLTSSVKHSLVSNCFSQHPDFSFHIMRLFIFLHHLQDLPARPAVQQGGLYVALLVSQPITF